MEQSKTKKRGTFAAKIIVMVILAVIVSNVICMVFIPESSKKQITDSTKHTMVDVIIKKISSRKIRSVMDAILKLGDILALRFNTPLSFNS